MLSDDHYCKIRYKNGEKIYTLFDKNGNALGDYPNMRKLCAALCQLPNESDTKIKNNNTNNDEKADDKEKKEIIAKIAEIKEQEEKPIIEERVYDKLGIEIRKVKLRGGFSIFDATSKSGIELRVLLSPLGGILGIYSTPQEVKSAYNNYDAKWKQILEEKTQITEEKINEFIPESKSIRFNEHYCLSQTPELEEVNMGNGNVVNSPTIKIKYGLGRIFCDSDYLNDYLNNLAICIDPESFGSAETYFDDMEDLLLTFINEHNQLEKYENDESEKNLQTAKNIIEQIDISKPNTKTYGTAKKTNEPGPNLKILLYLYSNGYKIHTKQSPIEPKVTFILCDPNGKQTEIYNIRELCRACLEQYNKLTGNKQNIEKTDKPDKPGTITETIYLDFGYFCDYEKDENGKETYYLYDPNGVFLGKDHSKNDFAKRLYSNSKIYKKSKKEEKKIDDQIKYLQTKIPKERMWQKKINYYMNKKMLNAYHNTSEIKNPHKKPKSEIYLTTTHNEKELKEAKILSDSAKLEKNIETIFEEEKDYKGLQNMQKKLKELKKAQLKANIEYLKKIIIHLINEWKKPIENKNNLLFQTIKSNAAWFDENCEDHLEPRELREILNKLKYIEKVNENILPILLEKCNQEYENLCDQNIVLNY